jgi:hypothetical protein
LNFIGQRDKASPIQGQPNLVQIGWMNGLTIQIMPVWKSIASATTGKVHLLY